MRAFSAATTALIWALTLHAANAETVSVDARATTAPLSGGLNMGEARTPDGHTLTVNNQYLMKDGQPWLPVMGEFHYTRVPRADWEDQLLKMKAAGVDIVSTYIIWQHHEEHRGQYDWSGNHDLRAFVELAAKHGLYVFVRPGPWAHAEVRYGGIPDWVVDSVPTRRNDPTYLAYVDSFYQQVGQQLRGLMWKDGGPVVGVQIENEYNRTGPQQGREHIAALKAMLIKDGFDLPLYTVTGWDHTVFPRGEVLPVFGTYVDEPWDASTQKLPPKASYMFQFGIRNEKGLGAQAGTSTEDDGERDLGITPFLGAEYGAGVPVMYRRRPILDPDDISSMVTAKLGSGVNLMGYYMFQGGQNPTGAPSREETTAIGGYNDLPKLGYDFQAPLGQYGEAHPVLARLRPIHVFLNAFGDRLAPMATHAPAGYNQDSGDLKTLRWSVRSDGTHGFVFVNNHVRQYAMATHRAVQFKISLASGDLTFPSQGVDIADGAYFIWPINFDLSGVTLTYATAQPLTKIKDAKGDLYVFSASDNIPVELAFNAADIASVHGAKSSVANGRLIVTGVKPTTNGLIEVRTRSGKTARILILTQTQATQISILPISGAPHLVLTDAEAFEAPAGGVALRQMGDAHFHAAIYPALPATSGKRAKTDGLFQVFDITLPAKTLTAQLTQVRPAQKVPPLKMTGPEKTAVQPQPETFGASAAWQITLPADVLAGVDDVYMRVDYQGDVARLLSGSEMLDDAYFNGPAWNIGLKRYAARLDKPLTLTVLPLREDAQIYLDEAWRPRTFTDGQIAEVRSVTLIPEYRITIGQ